MDPTYEYLWAAGYDLPPTPPKPVEKPVQRKRGKGKRGRSKK